jgi:hypothetical protein
MAVLPKRDLPVVGRAVAGTHGQALRDGCQIPGVEYRSEPTETRRDCPRLPGSVIVI